MEGDRELVERCRRLAVSVPLLVLALTLTACEPSGYVRHFTDADAVGVWRSTTPGVDSVVTVNADSTVEIKDWPSHLNCEEPLADSIDRLGPGEVEDIEGEWQLIDKVAWGFWIIFPEDCVQQPQPWVHRDEDGHLAMTFYLESVSDPDTALPAQMLVLRKD